MPEPLRALLLALCTLFVAAPAAAPAIAADPMQVLIFSHSTGYRHASIETGVAAIKAMGEGQGLKMVASEDPNLFSEAGLKAFDAIVFVSIATKKDDPASEWFTGKRREALQAFVRRGGGIVGVHAAADSHYHWPWFGRLIGGRFVSHPEGTPTGTLRVVDADHPATKGLSATVTRSDEWYYYDDFNPEVRVLVTLDPASIGQKDVNPNPISWAHEFEGARVFYTGLGHTAESFKDAWVMQHLKQGLDWVLKR